jgi:hypothetical protein
MAKWIKKAIAHPGAFGHHTLKATRRLAKRKGVVGRRARLALTLRKLPRRRRRK